MIRYSLKTWFLLSGFPTLCTSGANSHGQTLAVGFSLCDEVFNTKVADLSPFVGV
jgi:hypothetical protein